MLVKVLFINVEYQLQTTVPSAAVNELVRECARYRPNSRRIAAIFIGQGFTREPAVTLYYSVLTECDSSNLIVASLCFQNFINMAA